MFNCIGKVYANWSSVTHFQVTKPILYIKILDIILYTDGNILGIHMFFYKSIWFIYKFEALFITSSIWQNFHLVSISL